jgi:small-conductance mechanosensitive channel
VIIATVSLVLVALVLDPFLLVAFGSLNPNPTSDTLAGVISFLVASLVVGYVFALDIQEESRVRAIGVIVVLSTFTYTTFSTIWMANGFAYPRFRNFMNSMFNRTVWTDYDLNAYAALTVSLQAIVCIVIGFIGLYVGSMLRKPSTSLRS